MHLNRGPKPLSIKQLIWQYFGKHMIFFQQQQQQNEQNKNKVPKNWPAVLVTDIYVLSGYLKTRYGCSCTVNHYNIQIWREIVPILMYKIIMSGHFLFGIACCVFLLCWPFPVSWYFSHADKLMALAGVVEMGAWMVLRIYCIMIWSWKLSPTGRSATSGICFDGHHTKVKLCKCMLGRLKNLIGK